MTITELINKNRIDTLLANKITSRVFDATQHSLLIAAIAGENYNFDELNSSVFKLLLHYFNGSAEFETMFPEKNYSLHKGLMLMGQVGTGKTMIMRIFKRYCENTFLNLRFNFADVREVNSHFVKEGNLDKFTIEIEPSNYYPKKINIFHFCFDDLGTEKESVKYFGTEASPIAELILDRYVIFKENKKLTHITTNLSVQSLKERYGERISDRMNEMFNVIPVLGKSRRK